MYRVILDTVVFVRALINPYGRWGSLLFRHHTRYRLFVSEPLVQELLDVLHRPELASKFRSLPGLDVRRVLDLVGDAEAVELGPMPKISRDPNDDPFLATAAAAGADFLVTEDADLLVLEQYGRTRIVSAERFLEELERPQGDP